ncbi:MULTISPECIES: hypothetical protein [Campylobacter]|uniref:hypothetical protein n=1 Tax=Campylobacter TaxID=194 RepID=UPI0023F0195B|nr:MULTISPECIES: hypothetical protein [Campylobacter]MCI6641465.1 hypothetical protein [Campylobacter sp.]MDD7422145.1 hypothetical protein [Campylobacter hominis]MDY3117806.1 hypothetical protein [Campylobacter hominis]
MATQKTNIDRFKTNYPKAFTKLEQAIEIGDKLQEMDKKIAKEITKKLKNIKPSEAIKLFREAEKRTS